MNAAALIYARHWLGTPFVAGGSVQGIGCDCAGLIEGLARELGLAYPPRDMVQSDVLAAASAFLIPAKAVTPGCLILLSPQPNGAPLHAALVTDTDTIIHAHWRAGVIENRFGGWFTRRVTHIFAWPTPLVLKDN
jgi:NlpC/P60 family putative phage cell wall peptidase